MSLAMLVGSTLGFGGSAAFAQDNFRQEYHHHKNAYQEGYEGGYQEGYHLAFRNGFDDGFNGRAYENRANTRDGYAGYNEGYRRGKAKAFFGQARFPW
jgi:hypothetical protein